MLARIINVPTHELWGFCLYDFLWITITFDVHLNSIPSHDDFLLLRKLLSLLITLNLCVTVFNHEVIKQVDIVSLVIVIIESVPKAIVLIFIHWTTGSSIASSISHQKTLIHLGDLHLIKCSVEVHRYFKVIITVITLLRDLGLVFLLYFSYLNIGSLQSFVELLIKSKEVILSSLLFPVFLIELLIVFLYLLDSLS